MPSSLAGRSADAQGNTRRPVSNCLRVAQAIKASALKVVSADEAVGGGNDAIGGERPCGCGTQCAALLEQEFIPRNWPGEDQIVSCGGELQQG